jgi:hypothetical protein
MLPAGPKVAYRYSLGASRSISTSMGDMLVCFTLKSGAPLKIEPVVYLTTHSYSDTARAQEALAISYAPTHRNRVVLTAGLPICNSQFQKYDPTDLGSLTWPAFGHHGGGPELILWGKGAPTLRASARELGVDGRLEGGSTDPFHQDDVLPWNELELARALAKGGSLAPLFEDTEVETVSVKIAPPGYSFSWKSGPRLFSMSVAHRDQFLGVAVRLWGYVWIDQALSGYSRRIGWGPISKELYFPSWFGIWPTKIERCFTDIARSLMRVRPNSRSTWVQRIPC